MISQPDTISSMKSKLFAIAALLLGSTSLLPGNEVESNVSVALKFHYNPQDYQPQGNFVTKAYLTYAINNAVLIDSINAANQGQPNFPISRKARLIRKEFFLASGESDEIRYVLRDNKSNQEVDVTDCFVVRIIERAEKGKISTVNGTGSVSAVAIDQFTYSASPQGEGVDSADGAGISRYSSKIVLVKGSTDRVQLLSYSSKLGGLAAFLVPVAPRSSERQFIEGMVEGSIRISGSKVLPPRPR